MSDEERGEEPAEQPAEASDGDALDAVGELGDELRNPVEGDDKVAALSSEELVRVKESMARLQRVLNPNSLAGMIGANSLHKKFERMGLSDAAYKGLIGRLPESAFKGVIGKNLMPKIQVEPSWMKQWSFINSDVYKIAGIGQSNLASFNSILAKNADFGFSTQVSKLVAGFAAEQTSFLSRITPLLESVRTSFYPSNLRDIEELRLEDVEEVVMLDGIALYEVPRAEIAEKLLSASTSAERRKILGRRWKAIAVDCRASLSECGTSETANLVKVALDGIDALERGQNHSAQALAGSLVDTMLRKYLPKTKPLLVPGRKTKSPDAYLEFGVRKYVALAPIWQAYQQYHQEQGDPIPRTFNRHATAHSVSSQQFSRRNAVQGLMLVCGLLRFLDEEAAAVEAA